MHKRSSIITRDRKEDNIQNVHCMYIGLSEITSAPILFRFKFSLKILQLRICIRAHFPTHSSWFLLQLVSAPSLLLSVLWPVQIPQVPSWHWYLMGGRGEGGWRSVTIGLGFEKHCATISALPGLDLLCCPWLLLFLSSSLCPMTCILSDGQWVGGSFFWPIAVSHLLWYTEENETE